MEVVGYIARCISTQNVDEKSVYVLQFALIILAPVLMAACCYVLFSRILFLVVPHEARTFKLCWVPPRFITPLFVGFDVVALLLQLIGAVMLSSVSSGETSASEKLNRGKYFAQAGVIIQLIAFGLFSVAAVRFNFTSKRFLKSISERYESAGEKLYIIDGIVKKKHWPALLRTVNFTTLLILVCRSNLEARYRRLTLVTGQVRSIYRLVEFTEGTTGYINSHEWTMYVFDALVIYPCVALYVHWHPGKYLPYLGFRLPKESR